MNPTCGTGVPSSASRRHALAALAVTAFLFAAPPARGQTDNFNDGDDAGWSRFSPLGTFGAGGVYTFPDGGYRIVAPGSPDPAQLGPGRAGSFRNDASYSRFYVAVDIIDWDDALDQSFGVLARVDPGSVGLGTLDGYAFTYSNDGPSIDISRVVNEDPVEGTAGVVTLTPGQDYRLVFEGNGDQLRGAVYALSDLVTPLAEVNRTDATYATGISGLVVFDNGNGAAGANAVFDNYLAGVVPEPGSAAALITLAAALLRRRRRVGHFSRSSERSRFALAGCS